MADENPGTAYHLGIADQSVRTHFRKGRLAEIDPSHYEIWTQALDGSRTQAHIYIRRKP